MMANLGKHGPLVLMRLRVRSSLAFVIICYLASLGREAHGGSPGDGEPLVVRLVQPDRQAAEVLKLFEGSRMQHPAAALAAWKKATHQSGQLGKPLEALIAFFNPEMSHEWRVMHAAELCVNWDGADGRARWHATVPKDDGTVAAGVTALRMTDGAREPPIAIEGSEIAVERLGRPGAFLAAQVGDAVIFGSTRDELVRAIGRLRRGVPREKGDSTRRPGRGDQQGPLYSGTAEPLDSGAIFELDPGRLAASHSTALPARMTGSLLRGLDCRRLYGRLALKGECAGLEVTTLIYGEGRARATLWQGTATVDPAWLEWMPSAGAMGVVSLAFEPGGAFWDSAFELADRVEKTDPARAGLAPLRARINLLAAAASVRLEADLWPHLRGLTAGVLGEPSRPGRPTGGLLILHLDSDAAAERLVVHTLPRLAALLTRKKAEEAKTALLPATKAASDEKPGGLAKPSVAPAQKDQPGAAKGAETSQRVGTVSGRDVTIWRSGRDVLVAWGDGVLTAARGAAAKPERSIAPLCTGWLQAGKPAPQRLGVLWPARCLAPGPGPVAATEAWSVLAADPPAVWWGWNQETKASDSIRWADLRQRVHRFLEKIPLDTQ